MYLKTEGVILSRRSIGEADRLLTIFTRDNGKVTCIAKGVRRIKSRKGGHVEIGTWCKVFFAKGKSLDILTEVETKKAFGIEEFENKKANSIYHLLELIENLTADKQRNTHLFILLVNFLKKIASNEDFNLVSSVFKIKILSQLGFFTPKSLKDSSSKKLLEFLEDNEFDYIKKKVNLEEKSYLKLLTFLDSMIENITERKIKTNRFINGSV